MNSSQDHAPQSFYCPITMKLMEHPVIDKEGNSYEKDAIEEWLKTNSTSPITRSPLYVSDLTPNRALQDLIEEYIKSNDPPHDIIIRAPNAQENPSIENVFDLKVHSASDVTMLSIIPPNEGKRMPMDICCVIDVSGSMSAETEVKMVDGTVERNGLSVLDVVKHAVKTVIHSLNEQDRIAIVSFSSSAKVELSITSATETGKTRAQCVVDRLCPSGMTNLWEGLKTGVKLLNDDNLRMKFVYLLTDGEPTVEPPRGHIPMLKDLLARNEEGNCSINTFGFGYKLDSSLLEEFALLGKGVYGYIPDAAMVGTVFIHAISNSIVSAARNIVVSIYAEDDQLDVVEIPSIQYGQERNIILPAYDRPITSATMRMDPQKKIDYTNIVVENGHDNLLIEKIRNSISLSIRHDVKSESNQEVKELIAEIMQSNVRSNERIQAYLQDLQNEISMAFDARYFHRWGKHYLRSIAFAYASQQCNNFKDPGVQTFGGKLFEQTRLKIDDVFNNLPPPTPSVVIYDSPVSQVPQASQAFSMASYNSQGAVCFAEDCIVLMKNGSQKKVQDIVRGDVVSSGAIVLCVTKNPVAQADLVVFDSGLRITPWHPIQDHSGTWQFPYSIKKPESYSNINLYNLLLDFDHKIIVNGVTCVTLAHESNNPVCAHPFYGTQKVVKELQSKPGYKNGLVILRGVTRDKETGLANGFIVES